MMHASPSSPLSLPLWGKARLLNGQRTLPVRRKALAILYYLALEGETPRERLADLLWGHASAAGNLRVELSYLRQLLRANGIPGLRRWPDPGMLPAELSVDASAAPEKHEALALEGLDDLGPDFQEWLERKRDDLVRGAPLGPSDLARELAGTITPPYLLLVRPQTGSSGRSFAQDLARLLNLPFREGASANSGVHHVPAPHGPATAEAILANRQAVFVLEQPGSGEPSPAFLMLRAQYPAERTRYLQLPALSWHEARRSYLNRMSFRTAARLYVTSGGNPFYLEEVTSLGNGQSRVLPSRVPQRMRSYVQYQQSHLSPEAGTALERCSVQPGLLDDDLLRAFGADACAEELERAGWLVFHADSDRWALKSCLVRQVIYRSLQPGRRRRYHLLAAKNFADRGLKLPQFYHEMMASGSAERRSPDMTQLSGWARTAYRHWCGLTITDPAPSLRDAVAGQELALLLEGHCEGAHQQDNTVVITRQPVQGRPCRISWEMPEETCLLRVRGRAYLDNALAVGLSGEAVPLELSWTNLAGTVILAATERASLTTAGELLLPLPEDFEYWFKVPGGGQLKARSKAEAALLEFEVTAFRPDSRPDRNAAAVSVFALDECGQNTARTAGNYREPVFANQA
jgi:hypothetical protein